MNSRAARKRPIVGEWEGEYGERERERRAEKKMRRERMMMTSDRWKRTDEEQCKKKKKKQAWSVQTLPTRTPPTYKLPDYSKIT